MVYYVNSKLNAEVIFFEKVVFSGREIVAFWVHPGKVGKNAIPE